MRLVTCKADGTEWAVKIIEKSRVHPGDHSLQTEIDILCRVDHVNCVRLKEWFDEPKRVLLVMEHLSGGTLFDRIVDDGRYDEERARKAFVELASGLAYLHECGIAHRDLKPENFMLSASDDAAAAKLTDYGLSKILDSLEGGSERTVCGTPSYVAPEILKTLTDGGTYNAVSADAWSLGCNLYILLGGYPPFWRFEGNQKKLFQHIVMNDWSFDQPCWDDISDDAKRLIRALMEPDLEENDRRGRHRGRVVRLRRFEAQPSKDGREHQIARPRQEVQGDGARRHRAKPHVQDGRVQGGRVTKDLENREGEGGERRASRLAADETCGCYS